MRKFKTKEELTAHLKAVANDVIEEGHVSDASKEAFENPVPMIFDILISSEFTQQEIMAIHDIFSKVHEEIEEEYIEHAKNWLNGISHCDDFEFLYDEFQSFKDEIESHREILARYTETLEFLEHELVDRKAFDEFANTPSEYLEKVSNLLSFLYSEYCDRGKDLVPPHITGAYNEIMNKTKSALAYRE